VNQAVKHSYLALATLGGAGIAAGMYMFFRRWKQRRLLEDTPAAHIRSAPQGYVKLSGRARSVDGKSLHAPLTGRSCVWWSYRVEQRGRNRRPAIAWGNDCGVSERRFLLVEQGDHCLVDPDGADIEPSDRKVWYGNSPDEIPPALLGGISFGFGQSYRYVEAILTEDAELSVLGEFRADTGTVTNSIDDEAAALLNRWKQNQPALIARFDTNHDGRIDAAEWEAARAAALEEAQRNKLQQAPQARVCVLGKPRSHQPFLIAARSARQLARIEGRRALAGLMLSLLSLVLTCHAIAHIR
jgi:E3 Ubiquitin ligase